MVSGSGSRRPAFYGCRLKAAVLCMSTVLLFSGAAYTDVEMTGFKLIQETGSGQWEIQAGIAYYDGHGDVILQEVSARMVDNGVERVRVASAKGRYESDGLILHLEGDVTVASAWGSRFETANLKWDGPRAVMMADGGVELVRKGWKVMGQSVKYTLRSGTAVIDGGVRTTLDEGSDQR